MGNLVTNWFKGPALFLSGIFFGQNNAALLTNAGAPTDGVTYAGIAGKGTILSDMTTGIIYSNTGTKASPIWTKIGTQS